MAITKKIRIICWARADGASNAFTLNLANEPYLIDTTITQGLTGVLQNWFTTSPSNTPPSGVDIIEGATSASISLPPAPIVTVNVPVQPGGYIYKIILDLLFG
jgi:hypothetical protein